jgi:hypothetical protein
MLASQSSRSSELPVKSRETLQPNRRFKLDETEARRRSELRREDVERQRVALCVDFDGAAIRSLRGQEGVSERILQLT